MIVSHSLIIIFNIIKLLSTGIGLKLFWPTHFRFPKMLSESSEEEEIRVVVDNDEIEPRQRRIRRVRRAPMYFFDVNVSEREFREKHRVTPQVLDHLVEWLGPELARPNRRGLPLSPRQRIQVFLHFIGCNGFYHDVAGSHVISRPAVGTIVHEVCNIMFEHRNEVIKWPENSMQLAADFYKIAKIPCVAGVIDGCHIPVSPPAADEASFLNRKQGHSINSLVVAGGVHFQKGSYNKMFRIRMGCWWIGIPVRRYLSFLLGKLNIYYRYCVWLSDFRQTNSRNHHLSCKVGCTVEGFEKFIVYKIIVKMFNKKCKHYRHAGKSVGIMQLLLSKMCCPLILQ
jgi:hypothetical protein